jgi:hypothetical protein
MGIDMNKMRLKYQTLKNAGNGKSNFWRPQDGEQVVRIVPTPDGDPFKTFWFHYNVGTNSGFLSPKRNFGESDPLDDFVRKLFNENTEESVKMAKNLMARQRFFSPVVVRGEENEGVRIWGYGKQVYETLLGYVLNPDYGDITDVDQGVDLVLQYGKPAGASFPKTTLTPRRKSTPLTKDTDLSAQWLDSIPDMDSLFERKSPEDVGGLLDEFLLGEESAEETSSETRKYAGDTAASAVDAAFNELVG